MRTANDEERWDRTRGTRPHRFGADRADSSTPPHGANLGQIVARALRWRYDLAGMIGDQFEQYLAAYETGVGGPYDLPGGAPVDAPQAPRYLDGYEVEQ